ncbi:MAG: LEA type 2 family protein [Chitinophagaceae bacterium]|nr:LEA type 2 family protein [Chitinophagaceae bacterium]
MIKKIQSGIIAPLLAVTVMISCRQIQEPEYIDVDNIAVNGNGLSNTSLSADVRFYNPNKQNIQFKSGSLDIYIDNRLLGHTELDSLIRIPRLDTFIIPVQIRVDMKNVISNALSLSMKDSVLVRLEGKVKVGRSGVFITKPVNYTSMEKLDFFGF